MKKNNDLENEEDDILLDEKDNLDNSDDDDNIFNDDFDFDDFDSGGKSTLQKHGDLLKDLTNFAPFIKDKVNGWLGLRWSQEEQDYIKDPNIRPIMNQKCAAWCIDFLKTYTRENNIITHIGGDEYKNLIIDIIDVVWTDIGCRTEYFGIKNNCDLHRVCVELQHAAELVLMGAGDGKYTKFLSSSTSRHESVNLSNNDRNSQYGQQLQGMPNKKGWMQKLREAWTGN